MPKYKTIDGIRFFFYSEEGNEPAHVHIVKGDAEAKYWFKPLEKVYSVGFNPNEQRKIRRLLKRYGHEWSEQYDKRS